MQIIFVVKNSFHAPNFTFKISITRATRSRYRTRCPGWSNHPLRRRGTEVPQRSENILSTDIEQVQNEKKPFTLR
jgi:hypothetical protein